MEDSLRRGATALAVLGIGTIGVITLFEGVVALFAESLESWFPRIFVSAILTLILVIFWIIAAVLLRRHRGFEIPEEFLNLKFLRYLGITIFAILIALTTFFPASRYFISWFTVASYIFSAMFLGIYFQYQND